jgi:hypothetical protein
MVCFIVCHTLGALRRQTTTRIEISVFLGFCGESDKHGLSG